MCHCKTTPWVIVAILLTVIIGFAVKFMVLGSTETADDGRTQVLLTINERAQVLGEMRQLLASTQQVIEGLSEQDLDKVVEAASEVGMQATSTMDITLKAKLPMDFKKLGFATHQSFDDMARMAKEGKSVQAIQAKLARTMNQCVACHASFQLPVLNPPHS